MASIFKNPQQWHTDAWEKTRPGFRKFWRGIEKWGTELWEDPVETLKPVALAAGMYFGYTSPWYGAAGLLINSQLPEWVSLGDDIDELRASFDTGVAVGVIVSAAQWYYGWGETSIITQASEAWVGAVPAADEATLMTVYGF